MDKDNMMEILKKGVQNQFLEDNEEEIIEQSIPSIIIVDSETLEEEYPEYNVEVSLKEENTTFIENEEVEFINSDYDSDIHSDNSLFNFKEKNDFSLSEIDDTYDDDDLDFEDEEDSGYFEELTWGEDSRDYDSNESEGDILEEELLLDKMYNVEFEEKILSELEDFQKSPELQDFSVDNVIKTKETVKEVEDLEDVKEVKEVKDAKEVENDKFNVCNFYKGMTIEEYLRENPNHREREYVEHFFKSVDIQESLDKGSILLKKGKFII